MDATVSGNYSGWHGAWRCGQPLLHHHRGNSGEHAGEDEFLANAPVEDPGEKC